MTLDPSPIHGDPTEVNYASFPTQVDNRHKEACANPPIASLEGTDRPAVRLSIGPKNPEAASG